MHAVTIARAHGMANVLGGVWPLVHLRSFEAVFGPKTDRWLVRTVAGLLVANGVTQLVSDVRAARTIGVGTAAVLAGIDLTYAPRGRISRMYLADAAVELGWIAAWLTARSVPRSSRTPPGAPPR